MTCDNCNATIDPDTTRETLLRTRGKQTCRHPEDWPEVLARLMRDAAAPRPGGFPRGSLRPLIDEAVAGLVQLFGDGIPADPAHAVWCCFPRLERTHCAELAAALIEARTTEGYSR